MDVQNANRASELETLKGAGSQLQQTSKLQQQETINSVSPSQHHNRSILIDTIAEDDHNSPHKNYQQEDSSDSSSPILRMQRQGDLPYEDKGI